MLSYARKLNVALAIFGQAAIFCSEPETIGVFVQWLRTQDNETAKGMAGQELDALVVASMVLSEHLEEIERDQIT